MGDNASDTDTAVQETRPPARFSRDDFYAAPAASPRRRVLGYLLDDAEASVEELATVLTGWE